MIFLQTFLTQMFIWMKTQKRRQFEVKLPKGNNFPSLKFKDLVTCDYCATKTTFSLRKTTVQLQHISESVTQIKGLQT